jgi:hypothetical protein
MRRRRRMRMGYWCETRRNEITRKAKKYAGNNITIDLGEKGWSVMDWTGRA